MGIRFACHVCDKKLNIKAELAGKRGVCPACSSRFRIPLSDATKSLPVDVKPGFHNKYEAHSEEHPSEDHLIDAPHEAQHPDNQYADNQPYSSANSAVGTSANSSETTVFNGDSTWYVRPPSGGQYGPASEEVFRQWIEEGRVAATALVWRDGWSDWKEAIEVLPGLSTRGQVAANGVSTDYAGRRAEKTSSIDPLRGDPSIGAKKRDRSFKRIAMITGLSILAVVLVATLLAIVDR